MLYKKILPILLFVSLLAGSFLQPGSANPTIKSRDKAFLQPDSIITVCASGCDYTRIQTAINHPTTIDGDIIELTSEVYTETISINKSLTINGTGYLSTTLQAAGKDIIATNRVIHVTEGITVAINGITIQHGNTSNDGGGIHNQGTLTIQNSLVISNTAGNQGGGILNQGMLTVEDSLLINNTAAKGGGIANTPEIGVAQATIANTTIENNDATIAGAGIYNSAPNNNTTAETSVRTSTIVNNQIDQLLSSGGGAVNIADLGTSIMEVSNSTFSANAAESGGGIYISNISGTVTTTLEHITFYGNSADDGSNLYAGSGDTTLKNSILTYGQDSDDCYLEEDATLNDSGFNLVEDGSCGFPASGDPGVITLNDNGGDTRTHALTPSSPAIDIIPVDLCDIATDQRGVARPYGTGCDSGAFESNTTEFEFIQTVNDTNIKPGGVVTITVLINTTGPGITNGTIRSNMPAELLREDPVIVLDPPDRGEIGTPPILAHSIVISANNSFTLTMKASIVTGLEVGTVLQHTASFSSTEIQTPQADTVYLNVINVPPVAVDDGGSGFLTSPDTQIFYTGNVLDNDYDLNGDTLVIHDIVTDTLRGIVRQVGETGVFTYDPNGQFDSMIPGQTEIDTFIYYILDGHGSVGEAATVSIMLRKDAFTVYLPLVIK